MNNLILFFSIFIASGTLAQDPVLVGKVYVLPNVNRAFCVFGGQELADKEFEKEYAKMFDSIAQFIVTNKQVRFEQLHALNRREELVVTSIDE